MEKTRHKNVVPKISYAAYVKELDWVICTGTYLDHIYSDIEEKKANITHYIKHEIIKSIIISLILIAINWIMIAIITKHLIANPLKKVVEMLKEISNGEGDLTRRLPAIRKDEIGELINSFQNLII